VPIRSSATPPRPPSAFFDVAWERSAEVGLELSMISPLFIEPRASLSCADRRVNARVLADFV
jgi:hypothetical protein